MNREPDYLSRFFKFSEEIREVDFFDTMGLDLLRNGIADIISYPLEITLENYSLSDDGRTIRIKIGCIKFDSKLDFERYKNCYESVHQATRDMMNMLIKLFDKHEEWYGKALVIKPDDNENPYKIKNKIKYCAKKLSLKIETAIDRKTDEVIIRPKK